MAKAFAVNEQCPMEIGLHILSGKWKLRILWQLSKGTVRFYALQRRLGNISTKTLTQQLRELEEQRIVKRTVFPEVPPHVEYALTELGKTVLPLLKALCDWGKSYQNSIADASVF